MIEILQSFTDLEFEECPLPPLISHSHEKDNSAFVLVVVMVYTEPIEQFNEANREELKQGKGAMRQSETERERE